MLKSRLLVSAVVGVLCLSVVVFWANDRANGGKVPGSSLKSHQLVELGAQVDEVKMTIERALQETDEADLIDAVASIRSLRGDSFFRNPVDGNEIVVNPVFLDWANYMQKRADEGTVLVVTKVGEGSYAECWVYYHQGHKRMFLSPDDPRRARLNIDWVR